jgi:transcriptional regulator PpsR
VNREAPPLVRTFVEPEKSLGGMDAASSATLIAAAADVTLIVDATGVVRDVAVSSEELWRDLEESASWLNRPFVSIVAVDSRGKAEALLADATSESASRWRHVNHITDAGTYLPVLYSSVQVGEDRRIVLFGRDMRAVSTLQQRLMSAQQSMERDYARLREVEMRYRLLFTMSTEAVLILDGPALKVADANPAARALFGLDTGRTLGRTLADLFDASALQAVQAHLDVVRGGRVAPDVRSRLKDGTEIRVGASLFRQESGTLFLMRISTLPEAASATPLPDAKTKMLKMVENAPDGFVITAEDGRVLTANIAFLDMVELAGEAQAIGRPLDQWLGPAGIEFDVLMGHLRQRGSVRSFMTSLRGESGASTPVEISAVSIRNGGRPSFGFAIRNVGQRLPREPAAATPGLPRSVEQLTELVGRVSLKELVRESTDLIERLCIEAALQITGDNRASAAQMLGLSRQSLYMKLRRYGLVEAGGDDGE